MDLGYVIDDIDLSKPLKPEVILHIKDLMRDHHVMVFKNQRLTDEEYKNFVTYFGTIFQPPPDIPVLGSKADGTVPDIVPVANMAGGVLGNDELQLHIDHLWCPQPSKWSFLYAIQLPDEGGDTHWANLAQAYNELDDATKEEIKDLQLITYNDWLYRSDTSTPTKLPRSYRDMSKPPVGPGFPHPLVRTHPESGKKSLFLSYATEVEVVGWPEDKGKELIQRLRAHLIQEHLRYKHKWSVGDVVFWDNQITAHYRTPWDPSKQRLLKRISLAGGRPF